MTPLVGILMGSDSDLPHLEKGIKLLEEFGIPYNIEVSSAHRTPQRTVNLIKGFEEKGIQVIIAAAGGAAHLPGVVASHTILPVLGVPIPSPLQGIDSLYSMVQMPGGIPVATFGIGSSGGVNAVLFAIHMISLKDPSIAEKLLQYRESQKEGVIKKSDRLKEKLKTS